MKEGIERIKVLSSEVKDLALLKIVDYLLTREDMNEKYLNEEKNLTQMVEYIKSEAKKKATNNMAMIEDEVVYGWAIHYFDETNENLKINKSMTPKVQKKQETINKKEQNKKTQNWIPEGQLSLFDL